MVNILYKLAIKARIRSQNQGFVMPIVIGLGIAMVLVAATIMARSQVDRQNNEAQQTKAQSKSILDAAVSRVIDTLNSNRNLAVLSGGGTGNNCNSNFTNTGSSTCWNTLDPKVSNSAIPIQKYTTACQYNSSKKLYEWTDQRAYSKDLATGQWMAIDSPSGKWLKADSTNPAKGNYKLNSYIYTVEWVDDPAKPGDGTPATNPTYGDGAEQTTANTKDAIKSSIYGTLDISTSINDTPSKNATDQQKQLQDLQGSQMRIQLNIPIAPASASDPIPGLWIKEGDMTNSNSTGNNKNLIASQVWLKDCSVGDTARNQIVANVISGKQPIALPANEPAVTFVRPYVKFVPLDFPTIDKSLTTITFPKSTAVAVSDISKIFTTAGGKLTTDNQFVSLNAQDASTNQRYSDISKQTGRLFDIATGSTPASTTIGTCPSKKLPLTLPRSDDNPLDTDIDGDGTVDSKNGPGYVYDYVVSSLVGQTVTITPGCRVRLFILGNIDSTSKIIHNCPANSAICSPSDLQIYGLGSSNSFCFAGTNNILDAFVFAPDYPVGITDSVVRGSLWIKNWGKIANCPPASQTTSALVIQKSIKWSDLSKDLRPDSSFPLESVLPPTIGGTSGKASSWKICQTDTSKKCDGSAY